MFGLFKKNQKSELEKHIEKDGIEYAAKRLSKIIMQKMPATDDAYQFVLEEIEAASHGNEIAINFAKKSGINPQEYRGAMRNSRLEVENAQQFMLDLCMELQPNINLVVELRTKIVDNIMKSLSFGKYDNDEVHCENYDGDQFWDWAETNRIRVKFEPKELKDWGDIKKLDFQGNDLRDLPKDILAHTGLDNLVLFENNFASVPDPVFSLYQLMFLNLGRNNIATLPVNIRKLKYLKVLDLGFNQLDSLPIELCELTNLEQLIVHNNSLTSIPKEIGNMTGLKHIVLNDNNLSSLPDEILKLKNLKTLHLNNNIFTENSVKEWTEKYNDTQCKISFGYQKTQIAEKINVVENIRGGCPEDSFLEIYLNSDDGAVVANIFRWEKVEPDENNYVISTLRNKNYKYLLVENGLNAIDSSGKITPIELALQAESPSDENEIIEWAQIVYIQTCRKYDLKPNSKLRIFSVSTSGNEITLAFMGK